MKNLILSLTLILSVLAAGQAQNLSYEHDTLYGHSADTTITDLVLDNMLINTSSNRTVNARWIRTVENISDNWTSQVCDVNICYLATVDSADFILAPGDTGLIDVYFNNLQTTGFGCITVEVIEAPGTVSAISKKLVFYGSVGDSIVSCFKLTSTADIKDAAANIHIFPNPATEYILVKRENNVKAKRIEIYNMLGIKLLSKPVEQNNSVTRVELGDIQKGIYMVRVFDADNNVLTTKSFSKVR